MNAGWIKLFRILGGIWPFGCLPVFYVLTMNGTLNFGGGEKDIVLIVPLAAFCLFYLISYVVVSRFTQSIWKALFFSTIASCVELMLLGIVLGPSLLGIKI